MFKSKRVFVRNLISGFVPVILVLVIAVSLLNRSFQMLETRNRSILQVQIESVLHDVENELAVSRQVADQICVDSALSRDKMLDYGTLTLAGISRLSMYGLHSNPQVFLTYTPEQLVTKGGTCSRQVHAKYNLMLTENSVASWQAAFENKERVTSVVLERTNGTKYLLMLYYYPQSRYVEEKWVGFLFHQSELARMLDNTAQNLNAVAMLSWHEQPITFTDYSGEAHSDTKAFIESVRSGQSKNYSTIACQSLSYDIELAMVFDNSFIVGDLVREAIKMCAVGLVAVLLVSYFIWNYGKYRYRLVSEIKQLAVSGRPELDGEADEYEIIRTVLAQNFEELKSKSDDLELIRKKAKQQMSWMLLCAAHTEGVDVAQIMEGYGIETQGYYYSAMVFLMQDTRGIEQINVDDIPDVLLSSMLKEDGNNCLVLGLSLKTRDVSHQRRQEIAQTVLQRFDEEEIHCRAVSSGLVYEELSQMSISKNEAFSILQARAVQEGAGRTILFFDKLTHLPDRVSHATEDSLNEFTEALRDENGAEASDILKRLLTNAVDEAQLSYIKYKLVHNTIDVMREMEASPEQMDDLVRLIYLDAPTFEKQMSVLLSKLFIKLKKKDVTDAQILSYIEKNYNNSEISMRTIADHFGISERSVNRVLKKSINKTYKEYLSQIRLEHACKLLLETDLDVRVIIKEVGYYDVSSFNRLFKQAFNMTPLEYRNKHTDEQ